MNRKELLEAGIEPKTIDDADASVSCMVVWEEFDKAPPVEDAL